MTQRRLGVLLVGLLLGVGGLIGGLFGYVGIGYACGGTDVSAPSDHAFCGLSPWGSLFLWAIATGAPVLAGATGRAGWLVAGTATAVGALVTMLAVFAAV